MAHRLLWLANEMVIESVAAAASALSAINQLVSKVNETGTGVQQLYSLCSDFLQGIDDFEANRKASTFQSLSSGEMLRLAQIRKAFERQQKQIEDLLAMLDPELLAEWRKMRAEQETRRKEHLRFLANRKKRRQQLMVNFVIAGSLFLVGSVIAVGAVAFIINMYGP